MSLSCLLVVVVVKGDHLLYEGIGCYTGSFNVCHMIRSLSVYMLYWGQHKEDSFTGLQFFVNMDEVALSPLVGCYANVMQLKT